MTADSKKPKSLIDLIWMRLTNDDFSGTIEDLEEWLESNNFDYSEEELSIALDEICSEKEVEFLDGLIITVKKLGKLYAHRKIFVPAHVKIQERKRKS